MGSTSKKQTPSLWTLFCGPPTQPQLTLHRHTPKQSAGEFIVQFILHKKYKSTNLCVILVMNADDALFDVMHELIKN